MKKFATLLLSIWLGVLGLVAIATAEGETCTVKDPTGQVPEIGLLEISEGAIQALESKNALRLAQYVQCKIVNGDRVSIRNRLSTVSSVTVVKSKHCKAGTVGMIYTAMLNCK